jgi:hypothetical protein
MPYFFISLTVTPLSFEHLDSKNANVNLSETDH